MKKSNLSALIRRNIEACEMARRPQCHCPCGGIYHRKPHPEEWIIATTLAIYKKHEEAQYELDLGSDNN